MRVVVLMRLPFLFLFVLALASCAAPAPRPDEAELEQRWAAHSRLLQQLSVWELRARFAVRVDEQGGQAALVWQHFADHQSLRLNGPLGRGVVRITQDAQGARLVDAEQRTTTAASIEELLWQVTGWQLPVSSLAWWIRGLPVPGPAVTRELDERGRLQQLRQHGWTVQYSDYRPVADVELPGHITLTRAATAQGPEMEVRFVIERWSGVK